MKKIKILVFTTLLFSIGGNAQLNPIITSWQINTTNTGFADALTNVQEVNYSSTYVYVKTNDIPSWIPVQYDWPNNPWFAVPMNYQFKFRLNPTPNVGPETKTGYGHIGLWKNGCSIYNPKDAKSFKDSVTWFQNAWFWEHIIGETFDPCIGHPNGSGEYHTHVSPACLYDITDSINASPLVGYAFDSYPIYGGYGHSDPTDLNSSIVRLKSSYRLRNITERTSLPDGTVLPASLHGPAIDPNATNIDAADQSPIAAPLGAYMEDYEYVPGLGDLDEHNGRFEITAEYPNGIYVYHTTLGWVEDVFDYSIKPVFPYVLGTAYYGEVYATDGNTGPNSGFVVINEPVTPYLSASIEELDEVLKINLFPNPVKGNLNIEIGKGEVNQVYLGQLFDLKGNLIEELNLFSGSTTIYDGSKLANGVYTFKVQTNAAMYSFKLIVNN